MTIRVSIEFRCRLQEQAERDGVTLERHLARLADAEDSRIRMRSLKRAIAQTPAADLESYAEESSGWERTELVDHIELNARADMP